jgi:PAS domain-containing protein
MAELLASMGFDKVRKFISKLPWSARLGGLFLVAFLASILLPLGGIKGLLSGVDTGMEGLARSYAVELTSTIARVNGEALSKLDATSIGSGSIGGSDRAKGVIPGEVFLLDSRGRIKPTSDRPNPRPRLVNRASETQDVAYETDLETGLFYVVAPIRISIGNAPAQVRGFVYVGFSVEDFLEDTGRANDLLPAALLSIFLIFSVLFWVVRSHANRPILAAAEESELAMKGHITEVTLTQSWPELGALLHSVNRAIGRGGVGAGSGSIDSGAISESLVKSCSWPIIVTDGDLNVSLINDIALRIFGLNSADGVGAHISRVVTKETLSKAILGALRTMQSGGLDIITQTVNVDGSQRRVTVSSKLAPKSSRQKSESDRKVFEFVVVVIA